mmetsp:Transcript_9343/g.21227  ORF Transcript_9343/g.21227 Transcript_9343/m.21227 type:complete len:250 (+) Transcript_9343:455-1204(+)
MEHSRQLQGRDSPPRAQPGGRPLHPAVLLDLLLADFGADVSDDLPHGQLERQQGAPGLQPRLQRDVRLLLPPLRGHDTQAIRILHGRSRPLHVRLHHLRRLLLAGIGGGQAGSPPGVLPLGLVVLPGRLRVPRDCDRARAEGRRPQSIFKGCRRVLGLRQLPSRLHWFHCRRWQRDHGRGLQSGHWDRVLHDILHRALLLCLGVHDSRVRLLLPPADGQEAELRLGVARSVLDRGCPIGGQMLHFGAFR